MLALHWIITSEAQENDTATRATNATALGYTATVRVVNATETEFGCKHTRGDTTTTKRSSVIVLAIIHAKWRQTGEPFSAHERGSAQGVHACENNNEY